MTIVDFPFLAVSLFCLLVYFFAVQLMHAMEGYFYVPFQLLFYWIYLIYIYCGQNDNLLSFVFIASWLHIHSRHSPLLYFFSAEFFLNRYADYYYLFCGPVELISMFSLHFLLSVTFNCLYCDWNAIIIHNVNYIAYLGRFSDLFVFS